MKRWIVLIGSLLTVLLLMGCSLEEIYLSVYLESKDAELNEPVGTDDTPVTFTVNSGDSVATVAANLETTGLISDPELFRRYVQYRELDSGIQAGSYTLNKTMNIPEIARALQRAQAAEQQVTIPEGRRLEEITILVAEQTNVPSDAFLTLAQQGWRETNLVEKYGFLAQIPVTATLEGFLFPDTYRFAMNATAYDVVDTMLENFDNQVTPDLRRGIEAQNLTLHEGITMASIVEREAVIASEQPVIAGVYFNRLRDGWPLSADPTVQYALGYQPSAGTWWKGKIYFKDLDTVSPYNTYRNLGLPPAPIASPGRGAVAAVAAPAETDYYFFMADCDKNDGSHVFALNEAEHLQNYERCGGQVP